MSIAAIDQQVLASPVNRAHGAPGERAHHCRHRPAKARLAYLDSGDYAAREMRSEAAPRDFYLGQFRHV